MALKYELKYDDIVGVEHHFELFDDNYTGSPIEVYGRITLDYGQVKENLEAIRGQGLRVDLEADVDLTFEELFEENEKTFLCTYKRDSQILFRGWLNPEGFFEDYVNDKWQVSFDCIDGLGYLKELSFVDSNGFNILGLRSQLEILSIALRRTGIQENINVAINIFYDTLADTESVLENVFANAARYIKDDDFTVMSCEEVVKDILEPYGAVLVSNKGEWTIYKPNELFNDSTITFFKYDYLGASLGTETIDFDFTIGSQLDEFYPHHANSNQRFTNIPSIGAYRISYKYGLLRDVMINPFLFTNNGQTYEGYNVLDSSRLDIPEPGGNGLGALIGDGGLDPSNYLISTIGISVALGDVYDFTWDISTESSFQSSANTLLKISNGNTIYYANISGGWILSTGVESYVQQFFNNGGGRNRKVIRLDPVPIAGDIEVVIARASGSAIDTYMYYHEISITPPTENINSNIKGETFTFQRTEKPSARVEKTKQVFTGDSGLDAYTGTLYKSDGDTPTSTWYRKENFYQATTNYYVKPNTTQPNYGTTNFLYYFPNVDLTGATTITDENGKTRPVASLNYYTDVTIGDLFPPFVGVPFTGTRIESSNFLGENVIEDDLVSFIKTFTVLANGEVNKPILEIMGSETMRMTAKTMRIFSGDVFGYFDYLSRVNIDQRAGKYGVTKYSYDTYNNVISMEIKQMYGTALNDLSIETVIETDNVVEPTIRG